MRVMRLDYPLPLLGRMLKVSSIGYYDWVDRPLSKRAQEEIRLELEIKVAHRRTRQTYGAERLQREMAEHDVRVAICRLKRLRRKMGMKCKQKKKFKVTTDSRHKLPVRRIC
jgi:putative transposase